MTRSFKNLLGRLLFRDKGILPTRRLLGLYAIFSLAMTLLAIGGMAWIYLAVCNVLFLVVSLLDLLLSPGKRDLSFSREIPEEMERGIRYTITLQVENRSQRSAGFRMIDRIPAVFERPFPLTGRIEGESTVHVDYSTKAAERGKYLIDQLYVRYTGTLGLWEKQVTPALADTVRVIPDLTATKQYLEGAQQFLLYEGMTIRKRQHGQGEFDKIRSYVVGDDPRMINWRQTAKLQEVMTNEYEPEHGKYVAILIDCGRMMGAELKTGNRLEKALEAAMTVAAAALQNGDHVSVVGFSKDIQVYVPPEKGMAHLQTILHAIYNLQVEASESNYAAVLQYLQTAQKKRSMILLFSDVTAFLQEESGLVYLKRLRQRHLFFMIGVEDETMRERAKQSSDDVRHAMVKSIAQKQLLYTKQQKTKWERQGLSLVETEEDRLAASAVSQYMDVINRGLL